MRTALLKHFEKSNLRASKNKKIETEFVLIKTYPALFPKVCLN